MKRKKTNPSSGETEPTHPSTRETLPGKERDLPIEFWLLQDTAWTRQFLAELRWELPKIRPFQETEEDSWQNGGIDLLEAGKFKEAELPFKKLILAQPRHFDGFEGLARAWSGMGNHTDADRLLDAALCRALSFLEDETLDLPVYEGILKIRRAVRGKEGLAPGDHPDYFDLLSDPHLLALRKGRARVPKDAIAAILDQWEVYHIKLGQYIRAHLSMTDREFDFRMWRIEQKRCRDFHLPLPDSSLLFALFLLSQKREKSAFPILREFLDRGEGIVRHELGEESLYEDLPRIIASLWDGTPASLEAIVFAETLDTPCRMGALTASLMLVLHQLLERNWLIGVLRKLAGALRAEDRDLGAEFAWTIAHLKAVEMTPELKLAFENELIEELIAPREEIEAMLAADAEETRADLLARERFSWIDEPVTTLEKWCQFNETLEEDHSSPPVKTCSSMPNTHQPVEKEFQGRWLAPHEIQAPKTGRNDPCPCGSGKKFKKCCVDK